MNSTPSILTSLVALAFAGCAIGAVEPRTPPDGDGGTVQPEPDAGAPACRGNNDGVIARDELVFATGVAVRYRTNAVGTVASVDVRGQDRPDGTRAWDFSDPAGETVEASLEAVTNQWFARDFPGAQFAGRIDPRASVLGIYRVGDASLELLGAAGEREADGTRLRYDTPVPLLRFPLALGASWTAEAQTVDGMVDNTPVASRDHYAVAVDAAGELRLGVLTFRHALRVRIEVTQRFPAGPGTRRIQYLWMTECYGEVARVTSREGEVDPDFTQAAEFRRLAL